VVARPRKRSLRKQARRTSSTTRDASASTSACSAASGKAARHASEEAPGGGAAASGRAERGSRTGASSKAGRSARHCTRSCCACHCTSSRLAPQRAAATTPVARSSVYTKGPKARTHAASTHARASRQHVAPRQQLGAPARSTATSKTARPEAPTLRSTARRRPPSSAAALGDASMTRRHAAAGGKARRGDMFRSAGWSHEGARWFGWLEVGALAGRQARSVAVPGVQVRAEAGIRAAESGSDAA
jgi:hypothetical protein